MIYRTEAILTTNDIINEVLIQPVSRDGYVFEIERVLISPTIEAKAIADTLHVAMSVKTASLAAFTDYETLEPDVLYRGVPLMWGTVDTRNPTDQSHLVDDAYFSNAIKLMYATRDGIGISIMQARVKVELELSERRLTGSIQDILYSRLAG